MTAPQKYRNAGTFMMVAGLANVIGAVALALGIGLGATSIAMGTCVGVVCYGCCFVPIIPLIFGIYEAMTGYAISQGQPVRHGSTVALIGIVVGILNAGSGLGLISLVLEVLAYIHLNDPDSQAWIDEQEHHLLA